MINYSPVSLRINFSGLGSSKTSLSALLFLIVGLLFTSSCTKDDLARAPQMASIREDIAAVTPPADFNPSRCYGVWNYPPDRDYGWFEVKVNGEWLGGVATLSEFPGGTERYRLDYLIFDYTGDCAGSYSGNIGDLSLNANDPYKDLVRPGFLRDCSDSNGIQVSIEPVRPRRFSSIYVLDVDTPIQSLLTDTTATGFTRIEFDQVDLDKGFVRGRFAGRFYADDNCPEGTVKIGEHIVDEVVLSEGYFETYIPE